MPTRNINLTEHQDELVSKYISSGRYQNASEVIRDGLRLMESRDAEEAAKLEALRSAVDVGINALEKGDFEEFGSASDLVDYLRSLPLDAESQ
jgi:antitoxin ParD1/3/4